MKIGLYAHDGSTRLCAIEADQVIDLQGAAIGAGLGDGSRVFGGLREFLEAGSEGVEMAAAALNARRVNDVLRLKQVTLRAPYVYRAKILCHVINYPTHGPAGIPSQPFFFYKPSTSVIGPGDPISPHTAVSQQLDWETELAAVIGRRARDVSLEEATSYIAGYTIVNDVSYRDLQFNRAAPDLGQRYGMNWTQGKGLDAACPIGPWITLVDEIQHTRGLDIRTYVNGNLRQESNTKHMAYDVPEMIAAISRGMTLEPGDIVSTGTPPGTGLDSGTYLQPGDVVRCEIDGLGTLENPVAHE